MLSEITILDDFEPLASFMEHIVKESHIATNVHAVHSANDFIKEITRKNSEVVILDISLKTEVTGIDVLRYLKSNHPNTKSIIYSLQNHSEAINTAKSLGAIGFISKTASLSTIKTVLKTLSNEREFFFVE